MAMEVASRWSGEGGLLSALAGNAKPDHVIRRDEPFDLVKAEGAVKAHGALVGGSNTKMRLGRADRGHALEPGADQYATDLLALQPRQEIDVQMCRIGFADPLRCFRRMV